MTQIVFSAFQCEVLEDQITRLREKIKTELSETKGFILKHPNGGNVTIQKNTITDWKAGPTGYPERNYEICPIYSEVF